jgi:hypothetical protein
MFQARHINELARVLRLRRKVEPHNSQKREALAEITADIANMLERTSPRFNRERFLRAATPDELAVRWPEVSNGAAALDYAPAVGRPRLPPQVRPMKAE